MRKVRDHLAKTYLSFDPRSLGLFRIAYSAVLLTDLYLRGQAIDTFYTNAGLLPNHTLLWAPPAGHMFSLFFTCSTHGQALTLMLLCGLSFCALLVGYRSKLAQITSLIALISLNSRLSPLENGGDMVMNLLGIWTVFLPLGQRFSVDAVLSSLRLRREVNASELRDRAAMHAPQTALRSLAVLALILQFFVIYLFNVVHKNGPTWLEGTAVHYTLHQDRLVKAFGVLMREAPPELLQALTYGTMVIETVGAIVIISPFFTKYTRLLAVLMMPTLHLGFELCLDLGVFSFAMASFFTLLVAPEHWDWLYTKLRPRHRARTVFFDADCGICFAIVRVLSRLDVFERLDFVPNSDHARLPAGISPELVDTTIVVVDADGGAPKTRSAAVAAALRSLPFGFLLAWLLRAPLLRQLADHGYDLVAKNRARISVWLGFAACGVRHEASAALVLPPSPSGARLLLQRVARVARELCVALIIVACWGEIVNANSAVPEVLRYPQPAFMQALIEYPRLLQGWRMFAPHAPTEDFMIEIDAVTIDGRHVDPYNEVASRVHGPGLKEIPALLQQNQFFTAYSLFIWRPGFRAYLSAFREWVQRYPERTGNPKDQIVRFSAYHLRDASPPPGQLKPTGFARELFLRWPER